MKNSRGRQLLDTFRVLLGVHFIHTICLSKLGKSGVQRFKGCANRSWNKEVMAVWRQPRKVKWNELRKFRKVFHNCETTLWHMSAISQLHLLISQLRNGLWKCLHLAKMLLGCETALDCEMASKLRIKLQIISKLWNHLQVAKPKFKLAKWIIQHVNHCTKSTCANSDICNRLS